MAVTANQIIKAQDAGALQAVPVAASTHIYQGTIVFHERTSGASEGCALGDDDGGANDFAGIAAQEADNSSGSDADLGVEVFQEGVFELQGSGFGRHNVGDLAYATDNFTVTASSSSATKIGKFVEYISATRMMVKIDKQQA